MFLLLETLKPPHKLTRVHDSFLFIELEKSLEKHLKNIKRARQTHRSLL